MSEDVEIEYPISLDTALTLVNGMRGMKSKILEEAMTEKEKQFLLAEMGMFIEEERMLYGVNPYRRLSVMQKVVNVYSPILKKYYAEE